MPIAENRLGSKLCARVELRMMSIPASRTRAASPNGTTLSPKRISAFTHDPHDLHHRIDRLAGEGRRLRPEAQRDHRPLAGRHADLHRHRIPDRPDRRIRAPRAISSSRMTVASPAVPPPGLSQTSAITTGPAAAASARATACFSSTSGIMKVPRLAKSSSPSSRASAAPFAVRSSVTTIIFVPISGTSPAMKPWITDSDSTSASSRSIACIRSTKPRIGSREVGKTSIIRQSKTDITGRTRPSQRVDGDPPEILGAIDEIGVREFLEIDEEVRRRHPLRGQVAVRVELGADQHVRPDDLAHPRQQIALGIVVARRHHRAVQAEHHRIDRQRRRKLAEDLVAQPS